MWSNFWRYFYRSFGYLGLKKLISTHYEMDGSSSYALIYKGGHDNADDFDEGVTKAPLKGDGDFRSDECIEYLKQSDKGGHTEYSNLQMLCKYDNEVKSNNLLNN